MAKINIVGVGKGEKNYVVHIVITEPQEVDGEIEEKAIGERFVPIPHGLEMKDIKDRIVKAANLAMDAHKDAIDKRKDIEELEFPEIT